MAQPPPPGPRSSRAAEPRQGQVEELLATVAHELRRPLSALLGALATLHQHGPVLPTGDQQELLTMARRQGVQLQRLLEQLMAAAALDHPGVGVAGASLVDAAALATEAGVAARLAHPDHRISIQAAGPLLVRADPLAISRILGNLLDNAATHSPAGSLIWLDGGRHGHQAVLTVQDEGPGIPPEERDRVFQPYTRLNWRTGSTSGLGLGLYIARHLAHANQGELRVTDPVDDCGARLELRLPLAC